MKDGFIKVAAVTNDIKVLDVQYNADRIMEKIEEACSENVKIIVFPELSITGVSAGDFLKQETVLLRSLEAVKRIETFSEGKDILITVGAPFRMEGKIYNCAFVISDGELLCIVPKNNLKNAERRVFSSYYMENISLEIGGEEVLFGNDIIITFSGLDDYRISVMVGDDIKSAAEENRALLSSSTILLNPSSNIRIINKAENAEEMYLADRYYLSVVSAYAGSSESTTDFVYMGYNIVASPEESYVSSNENWDMYVTVDVNRNDILKRNDDSLCCYPDDYDIVEIPVEIEETGPETPERNPFAGDYDDIDSFVEGILDIQCRGLLKRIEHTKSSKAVIGISGGLDSTLALMVAVRTFDMMDRDRKDIVAITMPSFATSSRTKTNAGIICEELGVDFREIPIGETVRSHFRDIGHDEDVYDAAYENAQARERTQVLMDIANMENGIVVGTGDLSELALGWATYNGDQMSNYSVNAGIPKTVIQVMIRHLALKSENRKLKEALLDIVDTPISPELVPGDEDEISQKTEKLVGPYELHDFFLYHVLKYGYDPGKVLRLAAAAFEGEFDEDTIRKWLKVFYRRFVTQQFKRSAMPDGPKVFDVGLSPRGDYMIPSDADFSLFLDELEQL